MLSSSQSQSKSKRGLTLSIGKLKKNKLSFNNQENTASQNTAPCSPRFNKLFQKHKASATKNKIKNV